MVHPSMALKSLEICLLEVWSNREPHRVMFLEFDEVLDHFARFDVLQGTSSQTRTRYTLTTAWGSVLV